MKTAPRIGIWISTDGNDKDDNLKHEPSDVQEDRLERMEADFTVLIVGGEHQE